MITGENLIHQCPNGKFSFVGRVSIRLAYYRADGQPMTEKDIEIIKQCGPGFGKRYRTRVFDTREDAEAALKKFQQDK